jgi:hypothetical protein
MTKEKKLARRLALYLNSIGVPTQALVSSYAQWAAILKTQYDALEIDQRKLARKTGRTLIRRAGSIELATAFLPVPVFEGLHSRPKPSIATSTKTREEQFALVQSKWSRLTPPCPSCRMGNGFPKRSWPTREWAEEVWTRQHDRERLRIYACPVQNGFWHLGHIPREVLPLTGEGKAAISGSSSGVHHGMNIREMGVRVT